MTEERKIDQRIFDLHDEYRDGRIDRREFLGRSAAITVGGVSALWMAEALMPRRADAAAGPEVAAREGRRAMATNEKTANALLLDTIRIEGEAEPRLEAYLEARARPLLAGGGAVSGNVYHLREQNVPASALGDGIYFAAYQLADDAPLAARSVKQPGDHGRWHRMGLTSYSKIADYGRPDPAGDAPDSIMIVISHPTDVGYDALYNEWYTDNHMINVAKSPHFRSATRYRPVVQAAGILLAYLCIYEIEHPYSPELNEGLMHWLTETPDDFRQAMPVTSAGEGVLTLDIWGYCQRVWSGVAD